MDESQDEASPSARSGGAGPVLNKRWTGVRSHSGLVGWGLWWVGWISSASIRSSAKMMPASTSEQGRS